MESEERCVCVWQLNVDGYIWIGRGGGREHERSSQEKEARPWVGNFIFGNWCCLRSLIFC